jgi:hypothetical protein
MCEEQGNRDFGSTEINPIVGLKFQDPQRIVAAFEKRNVGSTSVKR